MSLMVLISEYVIFFLVKLGSPGAIVKKANT